MLRLNKVRVVHVRAPTLSDALRVNHSTLSTVEELSELQRIMIATAIDRV